MYDPVAVPSSVLKMMSVSCQRTGIARAGATEVARTPSTSSSTNPALRLIRTLRQRPEAAREHRHGWDQLDENLLSPTIEIVQVSDHAPQAHLARANSPRHVASPCKDERQRFAAVQESAD